MGLHTLNVPFGHIESTKTSFFEPSWQARVRRGWADEARVVRRGWKKSIFEFIYRSHFWSYEHVISMFLVCFDLKNKLQTLLEVSKQQKTHFFTAKVALSDLFGQKQRFLSDFGFLKKFSKRPRKWRPGALVAFETELNSFSGFRRWVYIPSTYHSDT